MSSRRQVQIADAVQQHVSELLQRELKDPRIGFATITRVEMSADLKYARIYVSVLGSPEEQKGTMDALTSGRGFIRRGLAARLDMRSVPEIQFRLDTSAEYSDRISRLLNEIKAEDESRGPVQESSDSQDAPATRQQEGAS